MADGLENRGEEDLRAASSMLVFSALVVPAPGAADRAEDDGPEDEGPDDDGPDDFERNVATVAAQIARLGLSLPTLERISCDLQPSADAAWGKLAARLRGDFPGLSDLHFAGTVLTAVEAIREVALSVPATTHIDSSARLMLFARGLGVVRERRDAVRALLLRDIDRLLGACPPTDAPLVVPADAGGEPGAQGGQAPVAKTLVRTILRMTRP